jgi:hypothetical protein
LIFVLHCLAVGLVFLSLEGRKPALSSLWLLLPVLFFATFFWLRREPFTLFINLSATLVGMAIFTNTLTGGRWMFYTLSDMAAGLMRLIGSSITRGGSTLAAYRRALPPADPEGKPKNNAAPILRGLLVAAPIVAIFAALLSAADPIFSRAIGNFFDLFNFANLAEYIFRAIYILIIGYTLAGVFLHGIFASEDQAIGQAGPGWLPRFLGWTEAVIVLISVDLLFAVFVAIQFRYFFGGQANIHLDGFTYAEYARRGFGELVLVALFSLLLLMGLSAVTRRESQLRRRIFSTTGIILVAAVMVMLVSAYQRLVLYETAYGFSRLRTYTHILMIWLGVLLVGVLILEIFNRERAFALAGLLASLGFGLTLNLVNVDAFIARQNLDRARQAFELAQGDPALQSAELDTAYLANLSEDAIPTLLQIYNSEDFPQEIRDKAAAAVTCQIWDDFEADQPRPAKPWQSFNYSEYQAAALVGENLDGLSQFRPVFSEANGWVVEIDGREVPCYPLDMD